jgi:uncharacterized caspase-like protein
MKTTFSNSYQPVALRALWAFSLLLLLNNSVTGQGNDRGVRVQSPQTSEQRTALIIGNGNYRDSPLRNPVNDARDIANALKQLGFSVIHGENLSQNDMKRNIRAFGDKIRNGGVGLFYFAGHGSQINGANYLIPVDAVITKAEEVEYESVDVGLVLAQMESAQNRLNIVILDACRNNPFARSFRSARNGLASIDAPSGTLIAYATAPGSVAIDGSGDNGLYTSELLTAMREAGSKIEDVFKRVRIAVQAKSSGKQIPWESSSLVGDFYFSGNAAVTTANNVSPSNVATISPKVISITDIDRTDPRKTAAGILQAYRTRDIVALSALSPASNREILSNIIKNGENDGRYNSLFSERSWRWQSAQRWTGELLEVRYGSRMFGDPPRQFLTALVKFGESAESVLVVTLVQENGVWCFEDLNSPSREMFERLSKVKPQ